MQRKLGLNINLKNFLLPKNNHWMKRTLLIIGFIAFDYLSTMLFCRAPHEEANPYARIFMETFGIPAGLTLFVFVINIPVYTLLSLNSHVVKLTPRLASVVETCVDFAFAWFIAGLHFHGGTSWFWQAPDIVRQAFGALLYIILAFLLIKPHKPSYDE
ncbi:MAG: hypothetical protein QW386_05660 [Candidatus Bathyarchaeia archaeon]